MHKNIALIGLSGSGKSTIGPLLAAALGWRYVDTDELVVQHSSQSIRNLFTQQGEAAFREREAAALAEALAEPQTIIATGGGIIEYAPNRMQLREHAWTIWLHAPPATLAARLVDAVDRPLLAADPVAALADMAARRVPIYTECADWIIATAGLTPQQTVDEIVRAMTIQRHTTAANRVVTPGGSYDMRAGAGVLAELPERLAQLGLRGRIWLISDSEVAPRFANRVRAVFGTRGDLPVYVLPSGEQHKTLDQVRNVYDWLLGEGVERGDVLLALGGGVVGDLAGFVAATVLRGIAFVQLPTTVLAMVDSAIGGKTGVDHPVGKNLIGAFHQPRLVLADTNLLRTLPPAECAAGWAEAIKHGVIGDPELFADLKQHAADVLALKEPITGELIQRAAAYKVRIVSGDEREQGSRITLNYGHTIGHAVEAESGYSLRHGEAVAIGMMAAGMIANQLGLFSAAKLDEQRIVLEAFGLPTRIPATIDLESVLARAASDKKVRKNRIRWVLPTGIGATVVRADVPDELVADVVQRLIESA